jgi:hypothetical protein
MQSCLAYTAHSRWAQSLRTCALWRLKRGIRLTIRERNNMDWQPPRGMLIEQANHNPLRRDPSGAKYMMLRSIRAFITAFKVWLGYYFRKESK